MIYIIACTTRTGSTLLCDLLAQTGRHGAPHEFYEEILFEPLVKPHGDFATYAEELADPARYWRKLRAALGSPGGGFGVKVQARQLQWFTPVFESSAAPELAQARYVRLSREDKLAQAISGVKALQTGSWHSNQAASAEPHFDADAIALQLEKIARWEAAWDAFFEERGLAPLCLTYEDLVADLPGALEAVGEHVRLPLAADEAAALRPRIKRQADGVNVAWRERFGG